MKRKCLAVGIILLFIGTVIIPSNGQNAEKSSLPTSTGNTLYVGGSGPGNYTRIQDAIDNASDGDTVFVYNDSSPYYENIHIEKMINLVGEERGTTIIDGQNTIDCITVNANNVTITDFTIQDSGYWFFGINITDSSYAKIYNNTIINNRAYGISLYRSNNDMIFNNSISYNYGGITTRVNSHNVIENNYIYRNEFAGLNIYSYSTNIISNNTIMFSKYGVYIFDVKTKNIIFGNLIYGNLYGIYLYCDNQVILNNTVNNSQTDIVIDGDNNTFNNNTIINPSVDYGLTFSSIYNSDNKIVHNSFFGCGITIINSKNIINNNTVNDKPLVYLYGEHGKEITEAGQVILDGCSNIKITNLDLSDTTVGLEVFNSEYCTFSENNLSNDMVGLTLSGSSACTISRNNIAYDILGVSISYSGGCTFRENNFQHNLILNVEFTVNFIQIHTNFWFRNYFDRKLPFIPKIMIGRVQTPFTTYDPMSGIKFPVFRPGFYVDLFPSNKPYDIPGMR